MSNLTQAIIYSRQNPESDYAKELKSRILSGKIPQAEVQSALGEADKLRPSLSPAIKEQDAKIAQEAQAGRDFLNKGIGGQILGSLSETPKSVAKIALDPAVTFAASTLSIPKVIEKAVTGDTKISKATGLFDTPQTFKLPSGEQGQTYQQNLIERQKVAEQGKGSVLGDIAAVAQPILDATTFVGGPKLGGAIEPTVGNLVKGAENVAVKVGKSVSPIIEKQAVRQTEKRLANALEMTAPTLDKEARTQALLNVGREGGVEKKGLFGTYKVGSTEHDIEVARSIAPYVKKNNVLDTLANVHKEITNITDKQIVPTLKKTPAPFKMNQFNAKLAAIEKPDFLASDTTLSNYYDLFRKRANDLVAKGKKNVEGVYNARKELDRIYAQQKGKLPAISEKRSALTEAYLDTRRAMNDFVAESIPNGDENFKQLLKKQSRMIEAKERIAEANQKLLGSNIAVRWAKRNPKIAKAIGLSIVGGGGKFLYNKVTGQ